MKPGEQDQQDLVVKLLRLKRYEQPAADFDARNHAAIRTRLAALPERRGWAQRLWGLFEQTPAPALRYATVVALLALVSIQVFTVDFRSGSLPVATLTNETPALVQSVEDPLQVADTNLTPEPMVKPVFVFEYPASNRSPRGGMQYGTGSTMPVRYDY